MIEPPFDLERRMHPLSCGPREGKRKEERRRRNPPESADCQEFGSIPDPSFLARGGAVWD